VYGGGLFRKRLYGNAHGVPQSVKLMMYLGLHQIEGNDSVYWQEYLEKVLSATKKCLTTVYT
jgi:hypothetical protein